MNKWQTDLYDDLMRLVESSEAFYFVDQEYDDAVYRIFSYRLASYTEFLKPNALECRGHMFEVTRDTKEPIRLASLPLPKFFNLNENPFTQNVDLNDCKRIAVKMDGSIISTYVHYVSWLKEVKYLMLKSKTSLASTQANAARVLLEDQRNTLLKSELKDAAFRGWTVTMEYIAPDNRIVINYDKPDLVVLCVRDNVDGRMISQQELINNRFSEIPWRWTKEFDPKNAAKMIAELNPMIGLGCPGRPKESPLVEGYVLEMNSGLMVKVKSNDYMVLHKTKDSINSDRRLYEAILEETADDLRGLFHDDPVAMARIEEMEKKVSVIYNHMASLVEGFHEENKGLIRKDYAIKGQADLPGLYFGLAMSLYLGKDPKYKDFLKRKWKEVGIKEDEGIEELN